MSEITFAVNGERYVRHGDVPTSYLIDQAEAEFGKIEVMQKIESSVMVDTTPQHKHILEVAQFNIDTARDQLTSLIDDRPMHDATMHLLSALALIDEELKTLE